MRACALLAYALITGIGLTGGCYDDAAFYELTQGSATDTGASGGGAASMSETSTPPTSTTDDPTTTTDDDTTDATTTGDDTTAGTASPGDPPTVLLVASPLSIDEASLITIDVAHSPDVTTLQLFDNGEWKRTWQANEPDEPYLITKPGEDGLHALQVRGLSGDDDAYSNIVEITAKLPPPGSALWTKSVNLDEPNQGRGLASAIGTSGSIELLLGVDVIWEGVAARLNADGELAMVAKPVEPTLSTVGGITHGPDGEAVVVGAEYSLDGVRPWIARVDPLGGLLNLDYGKLGDVATGVTVDAKSGRVYVSGYRHTPNKKGSFDAMLWAREADDSIIWELQWERPLPDDEVAGAAVDVAWDVAVSRAADPEQASDVIVVGESTLLPDYGEESQHRALVRRYTATGELIEAWISTSALEQSGARCVFVDKDEQVLVGGWTASYNPDLQRQAAILFFTPQLQLDAAHLHGSGEAFEVVQDLGQLPEGEFVYVADVDIDGLGRHDAEVRAFRKPAGGLLWAQVLDGAPEVRGNALTVTPNGHVVVLSTEYTGATSRVALSAYHP